MKRYIISGIVISFFMGIIFYGCPKEEGKPATPNVHTVQLINNGTGLRFEWDALSDVDGYRVYVDGIQVYDGTNTYYEVTDPAMEVEIVAYSGDTESDPRTFDYTPVYTGSVTVYDAQDPDPDHPSYVEFVDGVATPRNATYKDQAWMLFYMDSVMTNVYNNSSVDAGYSKISGSWEAAELAPGTGNYWTGQPAAEGVAYYIWFDLVPMSSMGEEDYFAKMYISEKSDSKYTVSFYFQTTPRGLRWLKTQ